MKSAGPMDAQAPTLFFLHVPKAGGTTFHQIIARQFPAGAAYNLYAYSTAKAVTAYKQLPLEQRRAYRLVKGHMPFGLHEFAGRPSTYITILRRPVERVVSYYYYVLASPEHYLHAQVTKKRISLADFAASPLSIELDNGQTRQLAAAQGQRLEAPVGALPAEALEA
ncbi:MAG: sulfotransferase family 2 domain-containing protein, partial [Anaerolineales bacterium]